jgi:hypothetical protein
MYHSYKIVQIFLLNQGLEGNEDCKTSLLQKMNIVVKM